MSTKKNKKKIDIGLKKIQSLVKKNLDINKINPANFIENTKSKLGNYYYNLKKEREKEKKRLEKKIKLDRKKEEQQQKKQAQKEKLNKIQLLVNKKINLPKIKLNPAKVIEETKC